MLRYGLLTAVTVELPGGGQQGRVSWCIVNVVMSYSDCRESAESGSVVVWCVVSSVMYISSLPPPSYIPFHPHHSNLHSKQTVTANSKQQISQWQTLSKGSST